MTRNAKADDVQTKNEIFSAMAEGIPYKSYIKAILGKVQVFFADSYTDEKVIVLLEGDPKGKPESAIIDVWSEKEDVLFRKWNKRHLETGTVIPFKRSKKPRERTFEESTDTELLEVINSPFLALQAKLNGTESIAVLYRIKGLAEEAGKSAAIMRAIDARLSEVQTKQFQGQVPEEYESEE